MKRWLMLGVGMTLAAAALALLATTRVSEPEGEIDEASRQRLEQVLREASRP